MPQDAATAYSLDIDHMLLADGETFALFGRLRPSGQAVVLSKLPVVFYHWIKDNVRLHRNRIWIRDERQPDGRVKTDIGLIVPTLRRSTDAAGRRVYFSAFDEAHARDIIAEHRLAGFDDGVGELEKVASLDAVPPEDRDLPVHALTGTGDWRVSGYPDLHDADRYEVG